RHTERIALDTRQAGDVRDLIEYAPIHGFKNGPRRVDPCGHDHARLFRRGNFPNLIRHSIDLHVGVELHINGLWPAPPHCSPHYTSSTTRTLQRPPVSVKS